MVLEVDQNWTELNRNVRAFQRRSQGGSITDVYVCCMLQGDGYFYMSLFGGNIVLIVDLGGSARASLISKDLYLSDSREHSALLDLTQSAR